MDEVLYDKTGNIRDVNTVLVPLDKLRALQDAARRYCWLREQGPTISGLFDYRLPRTYLLTELDSAIDAALSRSEQTK